MPIDLILFVCRRIVLGTSGLVADLETQAYMFKVLSYLDAPRKSSFQAKFTFFHNQTDNLLIQPRPPCTSLDEPVH